MINDISIENVAIKIASRCNINCKYCYIYNQGDNSYKVQPKLMSPEVYTGLIEKIQLYCYKKGLTKFNVILFGGEPLLAGKAYITDLITLFRETLEPEITLTFGMQTNGTLIDEEWLALFRKLNINFGISLDGDKEINDANRVDFKNKGTYERVLQSVNLIKESKRGVSFISFLNIYQDPIKAYTHFKEIGAQSVDFLFPDANFYNLPPGLSHTEQKFDWNNTPYADWYNTLFDAWFYDSNPKPRIRYLSYLIQILLGQEVGYDLAGTQPTKLVMIESNGDIEAVDDLRVCGDGFTKSKINILTHTFFDAEEQQLIKMHITSKQKLAKQCLVCPAKAICGANYLPTRYGKENGFNNPSVYCPDLLKIITHVRNAVIKELNKSDNTIQSELQEMSFEEAIEMIFDEEQLADTGMLPYEEELISFKNY